MTQPPPPPGAPAPGAPPPMPQGGPPPAAYGAPPTGAAAYSEWWKRVVAAIIDGIIIAVPSWIIMAVLGAGFASAVECDPATGVCTGGGGFLAGMLISSLVIFVIGIGYKIYFDGGEKGQTVGKMAMKIRVRDEATGGPIGYGKAAIRYVVGLVLFMLCYIPGIVDLLFPLWDPKRQTLHDKAANTVVLDVL